MKTAVENANTASLVFVYGSLKRGFALHRQMHGQQFLGTAITEPKYRLFDCGHYPGMVQVLSAGQCVNGEVYRVDTECLLRLDEVEGVDEGQYARGHVRLKAPFASQEIWAYFYLRDCAKLRDCGCEWP